LRNTREIEFLVENWKNEKEAALVYRQMADQERNAQRREILLELASTEEEHARVWAEELSKRGIKVLEYRPRLRAKIYLWLMKRLGVRSILQALEGVEKGAASGYLQGTAIVTDPKLKEKIAEVAPVEQSHSRILAALDGRAQRQTPHEILRGERWHRGGGSIRDLIFGMNDGLLSTFSLVTGVAGATASNQIILLSGIAGAVAGAISMTAGAYVSTKAEREVSEKHVEMERLELTMMPQQEENELALIYRLKGLSSDQARSVARTLLRDEATALETMSREELGFDIEELPDPKTAALASGLSFVVGAILPIFPYLVMSGLPALAFSIALSLGGFFLMGVARTLVTARNPWRSGAEMFLIGTGAAIFTYMIGFILGVEFAD
jgi:VIT1/CCC1 family predicted Fe2+/Mn2+ transporter/rubrerythrin